MLEALTRADERLTQRELGRLAGLSPAVVNQYLFEFLEQGIIERFSLNRRDLGYSLTPQGRTLRRELMVGYIRETFQMFQSGKEELARILKEHQERYELKRVIFYSAGQVTEVLIQALGETSLELLAIADDDPAKRHQRFFGYPIISGDEIADYHPDAVIITTFRYREQINKRIRHLKKKGIPVIGF